MTPAYLMESIGITTMCHRMISIVIVIDGIGSTADILHDVDRDQKNLRKAALEFVSSCIISSVVALSTLNPHKAGLCARG